VGAKSETSDEASAAGPVESIEESAVEEGHNIEEQQPTIETAGEVEEETAERRVERSIEEETEDGVDICAEEASGAREEEEEREEVAAEEEEEEDEDEEETIDPESLKVEELKRELRKRHLPTNGRKFELVRRLRDYLAQEEVVAEPAAVEEDAVVAEAFVAEPAEDVSDHANASAGGEGEEAPSSLKEASLETTFKANNAEEVARAEAEEAEPEEAEEAEEADDEDQDEMDLEKMTVVELRQEMKKRGLPCTGRKLDLIRRLRESNNASQVEKSGATTPCRAEPLARLSVSGRERSPATPGRSLILVRTPKTPRREDETPKDAPWPAMPEIEALEHEKLIVEVKEDSFDDDDDNGHGQVVDDNGHGVELSIAAAVSFMAPPELSRIDMSLVGVSAIASNKAPASARPSSACEYSFMAGKKRSLDHKAEMSMLDVSAIAPRDELEEDEGLGGDLDTTFTCASNISARDISGDFKKPQGRVQRSSTARRASQGATTTTTPTKSPRLEQQRRSPSPATSPKPPAATTPTKSPRPEHSSLVTSDSPFRSPIASSSPKQAATPPQSSPRRTVSPHPSPYSSPVVTPVSVTRARTPSGSTVRRKRVSTFWPELPALDR
jgi:hypothetical protein